MDNRYLYKIIAYATDHNDKEVVVYQALYRIDGEFKVFTKPVEAFYCEVNTKDNKFLPKYSIFDAEVD